MNALTPCRPARPGEAVGALVTGRHRAIPSPCWDCMTARRGRDRACLFAGRAVGRGAAAAPIAGPGRVAAERSRTACSRAPSAAASPYLPAASTGPALCRRPRIPMLSGRRWASSTCTCSTRAATSSWPRRSAPTSATIDGVTGVRFAVWAPNAQRRGGGRRFQLLGPRRHPMRLRYPSGVWELFVPRLAPARATSSTSLGPGGAPARQGRSRRRSRREPAPAHRARSSPGLRTVRLARRATGWPARAERQSADGADLDLRGACSAPGCADGRAQGGTAAVGRRRRQR